MAKLGFEIKLDCIDVTRKAVKRVLEEKEFKEDVSEEYKLGFNEFGKNLLVKLDKIGAEWTSVKDRLPKHEERCLIFTKIHFVPDHIDECDYYEGVEISTFYQDRFLSNNGMYATHWMPLPEPPETKGESEL